MTKYLRSLAVLVVIVIVAIWAYDAATPRRLSGSQLSFTMNGGQITLDSPADEPVSAHITSSARFSMTGSQDVTIEPTREGTGRQTVYRYEGELPGGNLELRVVRGSDIRVELTADGVMEAVVMPRSESERSTTVVVSVIVIVGGLFFLYRWHRQGVNSFIRRVILRRPAGANTTQEQA